ncbi:MAG: DinB family protein [Candidatus Eisenbacteria bacterium]|uniref:DinB family protein n=1 Tax=Eiseniibacteriota bacterium TaxID=2212470 RepID=A0A538THV6_UNCEI|nr:MAG: DinB family protein [Candidatus Eisenbacteria bacterium]
MNGRQLTVLWCVYHIIEHFAMHTGQILSMTKALVGEPLSETAATRGGSKASG